MTKRKSNWYLLTTKPKNELRAADNLRRQGYETYFPQVTIDKICNGICTKSVEPLFPNYLFINLEKNSANFNSIRSTRGVNDFVRFGMQLALVGSEVIEKLKTDLCEKEKSLNKKIGLQHGDKVNITKGPFAGLEAVYQTNDGLARSMLLLNMMNKMTSITMSNEDISKV